MANWEIRPLRASQMHYGAIDAYIMVELYDALKIKAAEAGENLEDKESSYH
jgi:ribonuclease D